MKRFLVYIGLVTFTISSVLSCQKDSGETPDTPDTPDIPGHTHPIPTDGVVDLGLSVLWTTNNIGAAKPTDCGGYFQWAGTTDVTNLDFYVDLRLCPYYYVNYDDNTTGWSKYCTADKKTVLEQIDDIAYVHPDGSKWHQRMPTYQEWDELIQNCTWTFTTINGVKGYEVRSNKEGYTDKSIFLPNAGYRAYGELSYYNENSGLYWTSSLFTDNPDRAFALSTYRNTDNEQDMIYPSPHQRFYGLPVRPVIEVE